MSLTSPQRNPRQLEILTALCNLPTAPYCEQHVIAWLLAWARGHAPHLTTRRDKAGNVYVEYRRSGRGKRSARPLVFEAHMDHPGFVTTGRKKNGRIEAVFRGGVKPSHFKNAAAQFFLADHGVPIFPQAHANIANYHLPDAKSHLPAVPQGRWIPADVLSVKTVAQQRHLTVLLAPKDRSAVLPPGTLGMWNLPDARVRKQTFAARVCDDLAGVAAIVCLLEALISQHVDAHVVALFSRAEEVGFAGVLAACENQWLPKNSPVIGLETSKAFPTSPQGAGPIIRVGDRTGIFSPALSHFLTQAAGHLADAAGSKSPFPYQRKLMDGGTCNSTSFAAYGYDSAGLCVALGNYHNMSIKGDIGHADPAAAKAGPGIASETINLSDFDGLVRLLVETVSRFSTYTPGWSFIRPRLEKMHRQEQAKLLYARPARR